MEILWHRRDLRVADNTALSCASDPLPVFVLDPAVLEHGSPPRVAFLLDALRSLRDDYRELGGNLTVEHGDPREVLPRLADEHGVDSVLWNRDYSPLARKRDDEVRDVLEEEDVETRTFKDAVLHEPDEIFTNAGDPYSVYTYYHKKWKKREKEVPRPTPDEVRSGTAEEIPTLDELGFGSPEAEIPEAGTDAGRELLDGFLSEDVYEYDDARDYPARRCTSRLSAHLKYGTVGVREVWEKTERAKDEAANEKERASVEEFQAQFAWREFYTQVLYHNPEVVTENYKGYENGIDWRDNEDEIDAWKDGETGYPIVDAGMRQLRDEGFMHNRARMIVASFLTKDLLVDWRVGYAHFRDRLVDHDTANDNGGWQWAASTGTDAQPYFRIFNPMTQGERYDEDAEYIKTYVPELRDVPAEKIHSWHELDEEERDSLAPEYPAPVVEHSERREEALTMFERARGDGG